MLQRMAGANDEPIRIFCGADRSQRLPFRVLEHSIRAHTRRAIDIRPIDNGDAPTPADPRHAAYTEFSFARFAIPALCGHAGKAVYMDSDMLVFADIGELWDTPFDSAKVLIEQGARSDQKQTAHARNRHAAVMLLDCAALDWDVSEVVARLGRDYDYNALMALDPLLAPGEMREAIPRGWNDLDRFDPQRTRNLHFTEIRTQPWVNAQHPHGALWIAALRRMLDAGAITSDEVREEVRLGFARPSLLLELGLEPTTHGVSEKALAEHDRRLGFVAHAGLLDRFAQRRRAIARAQCDAAAARSPLFGWWPRLIYRLRYGAD